MEKKIRLLSLTSHRYLWSTSLWGRHYRRTATASNNDESQIELQKAKFIHNNSLWDKKAENQVWGKVNTEGEMWRKKIVYMFAHSVDECVIIKRDLFRKDFKKGNAEMHKLLAIDLVTNNLNWILDFANLVISQFAKACTEGCIRWKEQFHRKIKRPKYVEHAQNSSVSVLQQTGSNEPDWFESGCLMPIATVEWNHFKLW